MISNRVLVGLVLCFSCVIARDEYVVEIAQDCKARSDILSCGKYEMAKFITRAVVGPTTKTKIIEGVVDFVTLGKPETNETVFAAARQMSGDSEFRKFVKFVQRQVDAYLGSRAISITLPGQTRIVDAEDPNNAIDSEGKVESRGKKKKASILLSVIMLVKLFKVKLMLALVLAGVIAIKKLVLFILLIAPSYLQMFKICKTAHPTHVEEHDFGTSGYGHGGHGGYGGGHPGGGYAKDWANSRAYAAYKPT